MTTRSSTLRIVCLIATMIGTLLFSRAAQADFDPDNADKQIETAMSGGDYSFCKSPRAPLTFRARRLCPLAKEIDHCEAFAAACESHAEPPPPAKPMDPRLIAALIAIGKVLLWVMVAALVVAIAIPIITAIRNARRDADAATELRRRTPGTTIVPVNDDVALALETDAESLLRSAAEHHARGELEAALFAYLHASLRALDQRGAIRIARHCTNGEYLRSCREETARAPLREIVRDVDRVRFGGAVTTDDAVARAAARAQGLVRAGAVMLVAFATFCIFGCAKISGTKNDDPAANALFYDLLEKQGAHASPLNGAIGSMPIARAKESPVLVIDAQRTTIEEETERHLVEWINAGGNLVIAGDVNAWPHDFGARADVASSRDVTIEEDDEAEFAPKTSAKIATPQAMTWPRSERLARIDRKSTYAALFTLGEGKVLGLASDDLFTNAGLARRGNAKMLVTLLASIPHENFLVAGDESGTSPASNPVSGLVRAGLGLGLVHALLGSIALMFAVGYRLSRPKPERPPRRRAFAEHVEATGVLYARSRVTSHALAIYARFLDERIRTKMPRGERDPALFIASRTGADPNECAALWRRAMATTTTDPNARDDLATLRRLTELFTQTMAKS